MGGGTVLPFGGGTSVLGKTKLVGWFKGGFVTFLNVLR